MKSQMASSRKGVVGRTGRNIPIKPKTTHNDAVAMYMYFLIFYYIRKDKPKT